MPATHLADARQPVYAPEHSQWRGEEWNDPTRDQRMIRWLQGGNTARTPGLAAPHTLAMSAMGSYSGATRSKDLGLAYWPKDGALRQDMCPRLCPMPPGGPPTPLPAPPGLELFQNLSPPPGVLPVHQGLLTFSTVLHDRITRRLDSSRGCSIAAVTERKTSAHHCYIK